MLFPCFIPCTRHITYVSLDKPQTFRAIPTVPSWPSKTKAYSSPSCPKVLTRGGIPIRQVTSPQHSQSSVRQLHALSPTYKPVRHGSVTFQPARAQVQKQRSPSHSTARQDSSQSPFSIYSATQPSLGSLAEMQRCRPSHKIAHAK